MQTTFVRRAEVSFANTACAIETCIFIVSRKKLQVSVVICWIDEILRWAEGKDEWDDRLLGNGWMILVNGWYTLGIGFFGIFVLFGRQGLNYLLTSFFFFLFYLRFIFSFGNLLRGYLRNFFDGFNEFWCVNEKSKNHVVKCLIQSYVRRNKYRRCKRLQVFGC